MRETYLYRGRGTRMIAAALIVTIASACGDDDPREIGPTPIHTPTLPSTGTPSKTPTNSPTETPTHSPTETPAETSTNRPMQTATRTPTEAPTPLGPVGGDRPVDVFVPSSYDPETPMPLVVMLHSFTITGQFAEASWGFRPVAEERGFIYAIPEGTLSSAGFPFWNSTSGCCDFDRSGVDDSAYLRSVIEDIMARWNVDERRIFTFGLSNGGFMGHRMACDHADLIAGIVSIAGAPDMDPALCQPTEPVHIANIHGTVDDVIFFDGGTFTGPYPSAPATVQRWIDLNGCHSPVDGGTIDVDARVRGAETVITRYEDCESGGSVQFWEMIEAGHYLFPTDEFRQAIADYIFSHPKPDPEIQPGLEIDTDAGPVRGIQTDGARAFLGVPYAAPTAGENRWRSPQPVRDWDGVLDATRRGPVCVQFHPFARRIIGEEDCLNLNVWTPSPAPLSPRPVLVWLHGGAFTFGSGADPPYDGRLFVEQTDAVVVTINYRVAPLGFFAHPSLTAEGGSGNFGIEDQQVALRWIRDNIIQFGGDPDNVTVFGESAGGFSGCVHMVSPASRGLVHRVISQSGLCTAPHRVRTLQQAETAGEQLAARLGCNGAASVVSCLRSKTPEEVLSAGGMTNHTGGLFYQGEEGWWIPVIVDGTVLPEMLETTFASGDFTKIPLMLGTNLDEGTLFQSPQFGSVVPEDDIQFVEALQRAFGSDVQGILEEYPAAEFEEPNDRLTEITTDAFFACPARRVARHLSDAGVPSYLYVFGRPLTMGPGATLGATHAGEIPFVFGTDTAFGFGAIADEDWPLSEAMMTYWARFAEGGHPNGDGLPEWPSYDEASDAHIRLDTPISVGTGYKEEKCDFWDAF